MVDSGEREDSSASEGAAVAERDELLRLVRDVAVKVNETRSLRDVLSFTLRRLCEYSGWQVGFAYSCGVNGEGPVLEPVAGYYGRKEYAGFHDAVMGRRLLLEREPRWWRPNGGPIYDADDVGEAVAAERASVEQAGLCQVTLVPVRNDDEAAIVLELFSAIRTGLPESVELGIESVVAQLEHMLRREAAYRLLERQSRQLRDVLQAAADAILTVRADGVVQDMNPAAERLFRMGLAQAAGQPLTIFLPSFASALPAARVLETVKAAGGLESEARDATGEPIPVHVAVSESLAGEEGALYILAVRDFSAVRSARQRQVHQERLAAMGEMMTALAHESRNALQRIQSCLTLLELRGNTEVQSLVGDMQSAQDHLQRLYEEVRSFAAPLDLRMESADLLRLLDSAWQELEESWAPKHVARAIRDDGQPPRIVADRERVGQVLRNVLENAIQASPDGGRIDIVLAEEMLHDERFVRVEINNQGDEVPPEIQRRAFDLLFSTKRGGTGMGLAVSRRIVQEHGGDIGLSSAAEQGTSVVIRLPVGEM